MSGPSEAQQSSITEAHPSQSTAQPAAPSTADAADPIPASTSLHEPSSTTADVAEPSAAEVTEVTGLNMVACCSCMHYTPLPAESLCALVACTCILPPVFKYRLVLAVLSIICVLLQAVDGAAAVSGVSAPDYLQRVIDSCQTDITHAHQLMILAMHAVLLETGLQLVQQVSLVARVMQQHACHAATCLLALLQPSHNMS